MSDSGKSAPLARMSKDGAENWAKRFTEHMAKVAGLTLNPKSPDALFSPCFGKNGETSTDARFQLQYSAYVDLPAAQHTVAAEKIRDALKKDGYEITQYRPYGGPRVSAVVEAKNPKEGFSVSVDSAGQPPAPPTRLLFSLYTPCLIPPGATQSPQ